MANGQERPDLYVEAATGLLAYDLSPATLVRLLDTLFDGTAFDGTAAGPAPPKVADVIVLGGPDLVVPEPAGLDAVAADI